MSAESGFVPWVEPIAQKMEQAYREIDQAASEIPVDAWSKASDYAGWSYKDHLSHVGDAHRNLQSVVEAILDGRDPDFGRFMRIDEMNEENRQKHLTTPVDELRAAFSRESAGTLDLLRRLTAEHEAFSLGPLTLSQALQGFAMHDTGHLEELRKALQA